MEDKIAYTGLVAGYTAKSGSQIVQEMEEVRIRRSKRKGKSSSPAGYLFNRNT